MNNRLLTTFVTLAVAGGYVLYSLSQPTEESKQKENHIIMAKQAVANMFKDPDSAEFRNLHDATIGRLITVCGEVNAKNGFGGYTGYRLFFSTLKVTLIDDHSERFSNYYKGFCGTGIDNRN